MRKTLIVILLFLASNASAEFTPEEVTSLENIIRAWHGTAFTATKRIADSLNDVDSNYAEHSNALVQLANSNEAMGVAWSLFVGAPNRVEGRARPAAVAEAWSKVDTYVTRIENARAILLAVDPDDENVRIRQALRELNGAITNVALADRSLAYADPLPPDFPAKIFPHGDYYRGQWNNARIYRYFMGHTTKSMGRLFHPDVSPVFSSAANNQCSIAMEEMARAWGNLVRHAGLTVDVVPLASDRQIVQDEFDASGMTRPLKFFRSERSFELLYNKNVNTAGGLITNRTTAGRLSDVGVGPMLDTIQTFFMQCQEELGNANGAQWVADCWSMNPQNDSIGDAGLTGECGNIIQDIFDAWQDMDGWAWSELGRFHGPFGPPPGGEPPVCPEQQPFPFVTIDGVAVECREVEQ